LDYCYALKPSCPLNHKASLMTLFGYGVTTKALAKKYGPATIYDDNIHKPYKDAEGNQFYPSWMFDAKDSRLEIPSPGMPPEHPLIQKAHHLQSEYDYFADSMPYSIWISGTNGKTTTTQMITHLLEEKGALSGGNIGTPLALLNQTAPIWVLETSSFTLHYTKKAKPNLYILLPITPDHLSWHGDFKTYEEAKLKPLKQLKEGEIAIIPKKYLQMQTIQTNGMLLGYETPEDLSTLFNIDIKQLKFKGAFLIDALLAMGVSKILFDTVDYEKMNAFIIEEHRQETLYDTKSRLWVNDTKATNIDATLQALYVYKDKPLHLIVGGDDKGVDNTPFFEAIKSFDITLYTIGKNEPVLIQLAKTYAIPAVACQTLTNAVEAINKVHTQTSVALLSPAAASLDQFSSYKERGEIFKKSVSYLS
jgi:UDP-N-acetylmuramoylalanine--D-glutamate ligase